MGRQSTLLTEDSDRNARNDLHDLRRVSEAGKCRGGFHVCGLQSRRTGLRGDGQAAAAVSEGRLGNAGGSVS